MSKTDGLPEWQGEETIVDKYLTGWGIIIPVGLVFMLIVGLIALVGAFL